MAIDGRIEIAITGASGVGKTTLVALLAQTLAQALPEVRITVINEGRDLDSVLGKQSLLEAVQRLSGLSEVLLIDDNRSRLSPSLPYVRGLLSPEVTVDYSR